MASEKSIIKVHKNAPTTIDFDLKIEGTTDKNITARLVIEDVISGCGVVIKAQKTKDDKWSVKIPNLKNFTETTYNVALEVCVDGYLFTPSKGKLELVDNPTVEMVSDVPVEGDALLEGVNSGVSHIAGPEDQLDVSPQRPEFPVDNDEEGDERAKSDLVYPPGQNNDEDINLDDLDSDTDDVDGADIEFEIDVTIGSDDEVGTDIEDIASRVSGVEGPQLPYDDTITFNVKEAADKILKSVLPSIKKPTAGKRLLDETTKKRIMKDPETMARLEEKSRKVRDILGIK